MNSGREDDREMIRQVVRGERPWTDLRAIGMNIQLEGNRCAIENPRQISTTADVHDLAKGFLAYLHDARALREWAFLIEAIDVDLDVENHPAGETLLNALWDASFGNPLHADVVRTVEQLAHENGSKA